MFLSCANVSSQIKAVKRVIKLKLLKHMNFITKLTEMSSMVQVSVKYGSTCIQKCMHVEYYIMYYMNTMYA